MNFIDAWNPEPLPQSKYRTSFIPESSPVASGHSSHPLIPSSVTIDVISVSVVCLF